MFEYEGGKDDCRAQEIEHIHESLICDQEYPPVSLIVQQSGPILKRLSHSSNDLSSNKRLLMKSVIKFEARKKQEKKQENKKAKNQYTHFKSQPQRPSRMRMVKDLWHRLYINGLLAYYTLITNQYLILFEVILKG